MSVSGSRILANAKKAKQDEFYTKLSDIESELKHYKSQLRGKVIFCNCDDPYESNFFKYFALNFKALGLKKLIATSYVPSPIVGGQLSLLDYEGLKPDSKDPFKIEINEVEDFNKDGAVNLLDVEWLLKHDRNATTPLRGDAEYSAGDFRSRECVELLKQADVVVSNPPFSLFREYIAQLVEHKKDFLIIGNKNAITYKEVFKLIKEDRVRTGYRNINADMWFEVPDDAAYEKIEDGKKIKHIMATWLTTLEVKKHSEILTLYKKYTPDEYPKYDNYDAIDIGKVAEIPADYDGAMGVPITYLDKHNPDQFEILSCNDIRTNSRIPFKEHGLIKDKDSAINGRPVYVRIVIKRKK